MNIKFLPILIFIAMITSNEAKSANKLPLCPNSPNCVSTQAADSDHLVVPFKIIGEPEAAWAALKKALLDQNRTVITQETDSSLHAEATSLVFRFVDDIDAFLDREARQIHIRSASRVGYYDLGVNRRRVETLREEMRKIGIIE